MSLATGAAPKAAMLRSAVLPCPPCRARAPRATRGLVARAAPVLALLMAGLLAGCETTAPAAPTETAAPPPLPAGIELPLPAMKRFGAARPQAPEIANRDLARDILKLIFELESGRELPRLTRYEAPIRVTVTGSAVPPSLRPDLDAVVGRIRREAGLDIRMARGGDTANLVVRTITGEEIRAEMPRAACFVVPGITDIAQYHAARNHPRTDWARLPQRDLVSIFVPADAAPQELRDCLHEELAQAIGPLNDLYRLPESTFNDDNLHSILTGYDMLILKALYAPELRSGMGRDAVAAALPGLLKRLNPAGQTIAPRETQDTPGAWKRAVSRALGPGSSPATRLRGANDALGIGQSRGWSDTRMGFSYFMAGRFAQSRAPGEGGADLTRAYRIYSADRATRFQAARAAVYLGVNAIALDDPEGALALLRRAEPEVRRYQDAALLSWTLMLQAEALSMLGDEDGARAIRLDSLGWARYGFGPEWAVLAKLQEAAMLNPRRVEG